MTQPSGRPPDGPVVPAYGRDVLGAVLPGAAAALGVELDRPALPMPPARSVCVVLIDGLGAELLAEAAADGDAPFLSELWRADRFEGCPATLRVGCPTTTATSMGSFGTGLPPGQHGLLGFRVRDPARGILLNELRWDPYTDPIDWQPHPTVFMHCAAAGVLVTRIGAAEFDGSGLTVAAQRGGVFVGEKRLEARVDAAIDALATGAPALVYLYWGDIDAAGHEHGWRSSQWREKLRDTDAQLARLAANLPAGSDLVVTADHGMVDVPHASRLDVNDVPSLRRGIAQLGGEPRMLQIYCRNGAVDGVFARVGDAVGDRGWVRTRAEAIDAGWFGPVDARVRPRIGDILVAARDDFAIVDSGIAHKKMLALVGHHGSLTEAEQLVPLLTLRT